MTFTINASSIATVTMEQLTAEVKAGKTLTLDPIGMSTEQMVQGAKLISDANGQSQVSKDEKEMTNTEQVLNVMVEKKDEKINKAMEETIAAYSSFYATAGVIGVEGIEQVQGVLKDSEFEMLFKTILENTSEDAIDVVVADVHNAVESKDMDELMRIIKKHMEKAVANAPAAKKVKVTESLKKLGSSFFKFGFGIVKGVFGFGMGAVKLIWKGMKWIFNHVKNLVVGVGTFLYKSINGFFTTTLDNLKYAGENYVEYFNTTVTDSWNEDVVPNAVAFAKDVERDFPQAQKEVSAVFANLMSNLKPATV